MLDPELMALSLEHLAVVLLGLTNDVTPILLWVRE